MLLEPRMQERLCPTKYPFYPLQFVAWVPNSMECESSYREQPIRLNPTLPSRLISICPTDSFRQKPTSQWRSGLRQLTGESGSIFLSLDDSIMQVTEPAQTVNGRARQERLRPGEHNHKTHCCLLFLVAQISISNASQTDMTAAPEIDSMPIQFMMGKK